MVIEPRYTGGKREPVWQLTAPRLRVKHPHEGVRRHRNGQNLRDLRWGWVGPRNGGQQRRMDVPRDSPPEA